ncbi:MAG: hypothetical protein AAGD38_07580 [Acidobacteriota bacterium]
MSVNQFDVVIVGGGPTAAAAALSLRQLSPGRSVALVVPELHRPDHGESLPEQARSTLEVLGVWRRFVAMQPRSMAWQRVGRDSGPAISSHGWHIDRARFDSMLIDAAVATGTERLHPYRFVGGVRSDSGWYLRLRHRNKTSGRSRGVRASIVIDATGRRAVFARRQGASRVRFDTLTATRCGFAARAGLDYVTEAVHQGWWYAAPRSSGGTVTVFLTDGDIARQLHVTSRDSYLARLSTTELAKRLDSAPVVNGPLTWSASAGRLDLIADHDWLAAGDAAMTTDPIVDSGLARALEGGRRAARTAIEMLDGCTRAVAHYRRQVIEAGEQALANRDRYYVDAGCDAEFWHRRNGEVSFSTDKLLLWSRSAHRRRLRIAMHLPINDLERLVKLCRIPRSAASVIHAFHNEKTAGVPDQRVARALAYLLDEGHLKQVDAAELDAEPALQAINR